MIVVWIYIGMVITWVGVAIYKMTGYSIKPLWWNYVLIILINSIGFPYAVYIAIKNKKL
ncbi:MAG: hypothetical protein PF487_04445 [Bacteroidales bacterium]|jgi:hypothetical protein|nr:hypothetical protein [Bacteroidales bacterium]